MGSSLTDGLNPQQQQAVVADEGPVLVLAGPGSGKTRVLTHRIAYLISERRVHPSAIMAVTFTNKAAGEMRSRVEALLDGSLKGLTIGTFHAICARLLRREAEFTPQKADFLIYDTASGKLYYDEDGNHAGAAPVLLGVVTGRMADLDASDIVIFA